MAQDVVDERIGHLSECRRAEAASKLPEGEPHPTFALRMGSGWVLSALHRSPQPFRRCQGEPFADAIHQRQQLDQP